RDAAADLRVEVELLVAVERRSVLDPQAGEDRAAEEIRQPADAPQRAERDHPVVFAALLADPEGVEQEGKADGELPGRKRLAVEGRSGRADGEEAVQRTDRDERRKAAFELRQIAIRAFDPRDLRAVEGLRQPHRRTRAARRDHRAVLTIDSP